MNFFSIERAIFVVSVFVVLYILDIGLKKDWLLHTIYHNKIWVHRTNSIEKLKEVGSHFSGVELDIVFDSTKKKFDVTHPPGESIGLNLKDYLAASDYKRGLQFWLDFKNLSEENAKGAVYRMESICYELSIKHHNIIIESSNSSLLNEFAKKGFLISYYLHWPGLYQLDENKLQKTITKIKNELYPELSYISSSYQDYEIMRKYFPHKNKLLWLSKDEVVKSNKYQEHLYRLKIISDPTVKVLLVQIKTSAPNR